MIYSQNHKDDYDLLDAFLSNTKNQNNLIVIEKSADFINQDIFFSKNFIKSYTEPTIGVDSKKVKKLIKKMDFEFLRTQKRTSFDWDFSKSMFKVVKYKSNSNSSDPTKVYNISCPVYSKNYKLAFIYFQEFCGIDCGSTNVMVLKKCAGKWKVYLTLPVSIS